jgi:hypothetical protein
LLYVIEALQLAAAFAGSLNGREQEGHEHADDRDHDEQLDQRETT